MKINKDVLIAVELIRMARWIRPLNLQNFSTSKGFDYNFVQQISRKLKTAGIVTTTRGPGGGVLVDQWLSVSAFDVYRALGHKVGTSTLSAHITESLMRFSI